jgi:hypothetical protein
MYVDSQDSLMFRPNLTKGSSHPHRSLLVAKAKKKKESVERKSPAKVDSDRQPNPPSAASSRVGSVSSDGVQCLFLHSKSLSLDPLFGRDGDAFTLPTVMHALPEFNDSDQVANFSLHAFSFLQESTATPEHSNPFDDDVNPRAKKKAHFADDVLDSSNSNQSKPATTALFIYEVIPCHSHNMQLFLTSISNPDCPLERLVLLDTYAVALLHHLKVAVHPRFRSFQIIKFSAIYTGRLQCVRCR